MLDDRDVGYIERIILAVVWGVASAGFLFWIARDAWKIRSVLAVDPGASLLILTLICGICIGGIAVAYSLFTRWKYALLVVYVVTYPLTFFAAWALAWCIIGLLSSPGILVLGIALVPVLVLVVTHLTRRVVRGLKK